MTRRYLAQVCLLSVFAASTIARPSHATALPADSGIVNVHEFGAIGDGKHDDTEPIRAAIRSAEVDHGKGFWPSRIVYFPKGVYRVTGTIDKRSSDGLYLSSMSLMGEDRDQVRIKLDDGAAGYSNAGQPKAVIYTSSSLLAGEPNAGGKDYRGKGEGNDAYGNYIEDLTIDVGERNPGAIAIDYIANNVGAVRRVRLIAGTRSGCIGLSMQRKWPGPLLVSDLTIQGFASGIAVKHPEYSVTLENVRLFDQAGFAIQNSGNSLAMRNVEITTSTTGIANTRADGLIVADHLRVKLSLPTAVWASNLGYMTHKDVVVIPAPVDENRTIDTPSAQDGAYFGTHRLPGFDANWKLKTEAVPTDWTPSLLHWVSVASFGVRPDSDEDATSAIRAAMSSGAEVVYFPSGRYLVSDSIDVPAHVRRLEGMLSSISIERRVPSFDRDTGIFRVLTSGDPLTIERITLDNAGHGSQLGIEHSGARTLILRDYIAFGVYAVNRLATGGRLFLENFSGGIITLHGPAGVWARQLNTEGTGVRITNDGSPLSILGLKTEQNSTVIENLHGAQSEVLGGLLYIVEVPKPSRPAFLGHGTGYIMAAYAESSYIRGAAYLEHFVDIDAGGSRTVVTASQLPARGSARMVPGIRLPAASASGVVPRP